MGTRRPRIYKTSFNPMGINRFLVRLEPKRYGATAVYPYSQVLASKFTFVSRFGDKVEMFTVGNGGKDIRLPRAVCPKGKNDVRTPGVPVDIKSKVTPRNEDQAKAINASKELLKMDRSHVIQAGTGQGKCHGKGTKVLLAAGGVIAVEDVKVGDQLLGPDGNPRTVLSLARGQEEMYLVSPKGGKPYTCNESHILSLKKTGTEEIVNLEVRDYLSRHDKFKHTYKAWRAEANYPHRTDLRLDPYLLGILLGDGSLRTTPAITTHDEDTPIIDAWEKFVKSKGLAIRSERKPGANCQTHYATHGLRGLDNPITLLLKKEGVWGCTSDNKYVPKKYLFASKEQRLELLAGLLDSDGHAKCKAFEYTTKSKMLLDSITNLAWGLGFRCTVAEKPVNDVMYYRVNITGDCTVIPNRLERKKSQPRLQKKDWKKNGFTVEPLGLGDYYGFEIDGDHLYLLEDCTVTHNTVMAIDIAAELGVLTVVVVPKEDLINQWIERLLQFTNLERKDIGLMQQNNCEVIGKKIVIASLKSLTAEGRYPAHLLSLFGLVIFDEVHRLGAETFSRACYLFPAKLRLGLSATTDRSDGKEDIFFAHIGPVMVTIEGTQLVPKVLMYRTGWKLPRVKVGNTIRQLPHGSGRTMHINKIMAKNGPRNALIAHLAKAAYSKGRRHVIFSDMINHLENIEMALLQQGIPLKDIGHYYGSMSAAKLKEQGTKKVILATFKKMAEGTDIPELDTCTLGMPRSDIRQAVGRILRELEGKKEPIVFDLVDDDSSVFRGYYNRRRQIYADLYDVQPIAMAHRD